MAVSSRQSRVGMTGLRCSPWSWRLLAPPLDAGAKRHDRVLVNLDRRWSVLWRLGPKHASLVLIPALRYASAPHVVPLQLLPVPRELGEK